MAQILAKPKFLNIFVTNIAVVKNNIEIWCQTDRECGSRVEAAIESIHKELSDLFAINSQKLTPIPVPEVGNNYLTHMKNDLHFYRVVITHIDPKTSQALVLFIDFGNEDWVPFEQLVTFDALFDVNGLAQKYYLDDIRPKDKEWDSDSVKRCLQPLLMKSYQCEVFKIIRNTECIRVYNEFFKQPLIEKLMIECNGLLSYKCSQKVFKAIDLTVDSKHHLKSVNGNTFETNNGFPRKQYLTKTRESTQRVEQTLEMNGNKENEEMISHSNTSQTNEDKPQKLVPNVQNIEENIQELIVNGNEMTKNEENVQKVNTNDAIVSNVIIKEEKVLKPVPESIDKMAEPVVESMDKLVEPMAEGMDKVVKPMAETLDKVVEPMVESLDKVVEPMVESIDKVVEPMVESIDKVVEPMVENMDKLTESVVISLGGDSEKALLSGRQSIYISAANSLNSFYCQLVSTYDELLSLSDKMDEFYGNNHKNSDLVLNINEVKTGHTIAARFTLDNHWYRAYVKAIDENNVSVLYIDYGNEETVDIENCRQLLDEFKRMAENSIHCSLADETDTTLERMKDFENNVNEIESEFLSFENGIYKIKIIAIN